MRRNRQLRDYRNKLLEQRMAPARNARKALLEKRKQVSESFQATPTELRRRLRQKSMKREKGELVSQPAATPISIAFQEHDAYTPHVQERLNICHVIDSNGVGGAQTMMMELVNGLNKYYKDFSNNSVVLLNRKPIKGGTFFETYGIQPEYKHPNQFLRYCEQNNIHIVVQHRVSMSGCIRSVLPSGVKYVLINHTINSLPKMKEFRRCDFYVSVCNFLEAQTPWPKFIHPSRKAVILNGVESDYIKDIPSAELKGTFKTGRCHRMVSSKFRADSLHWLATVAEKEIPGLTHYIIGGNREIPPIAEKYPGIIFHSTTTHDRIWKMSVLKALDVYFYETFADEGASVAILESLACGIPVLCNDFGGNCELIRNGVNGIICRDRKDFLNGMKQLQNDPDFRSSVSSDFNDRLHIRHTSSKYMQLFEKLHG